jgi:hypothetical protein
MLNVVMLSVIMLGVTMLRVFMLSVVILNVVAPVPERQTSFFWCSSIGTGILKKTKNVFFPGNNLIK